jgi:hypothetical protein
LSKVIGFEQGEDTRLNFSQHAIFGLLQLFLPMMLLRQIIIYLFVIVSANAQVVDTIIDANLYKLHFKIIKGGKCSYTF